MAEENNELKEIKITKLSKYDQLDLSNGFTCDVETGICGPVDEIKEEVIEEEKKNANNNMV